MMSAHSFFIRTFFCIIFLFSATYKTIAGPPFKTDDPQPVDFHHWEFYIASQQQYTNQESDVTSPNIEINYCVLPELQLHIITPVSYVHTNDGTHVGYSDTEFGMKYRFIDETDASPQVGCFPLIEIPTGNANDQLGNGNVQMYFPLWLQKSWGKLTSYGGGGMWIDPGTDHKNSFFAGWEFQYDFSEIVTLGEELYFQSAQTQDAETGSGFNVGGYINLSEQQHILFSLGRSLTGETMYTGYLAFKLTF